MPIAPIKPFATSSWISASPEGCSETEGGSFCSSITLRKRSRATLSGTPRSRSTPTTARRSRSKRVIEAGPRPNSTEATAVSGMDLPAALVTRSCSICFISVRVFSSSCTRIGIWRSPTVNFARLASVSPMVATRMVSADLIRRNAKPRGFIEVRHDAELRAVRSNAPRQRCGSPEPDARRPRPCRLRRSSLRRCATASRTTARARHARSRTRRGCRESSESFGSMMVFSCFCVSLRSVFGTSLTKSAARRTSSCRSGLVPPSTKTCETSGMARSDFTIWSVLLGYRQAACPAAARPRRRRATYPHREESRSAAASSRRWQPRTARRR